MRPSKAWRLIRSTASLLDDARDQLRSEADKLKARLLQSEAAAAVESYLIDQGAAGVAMGLRARHADVSVVAKPTKLNATSVQPILDSALFESGRPVIIVPPEWRRAPIGRRVLFADPSGRARLS